MDKGQGYDHEKGQFSLRNYKVVGTENSLNIQQTVEGEFELKAKQFTVVFHALPTAVSSAKVDGKSIKLKKSKEGKKNLVEFNIDRDFGEISLEWK